MSILDAGSNHDGRLRIWQELKKAALVVSMVWIVLLYAGLIYAEHYRMTTSPLLTLASEDNLLESLQAMAYLVGFVACVVALIRRTDVVLALVWAFLCLMFLGEEISWGQRIFDFSVPAVERVNVQSEFNLHNLAIVTQGGLRSADDWRSVLKAMLDIQFLFQVGFYGYFFVLPVLLIIKSLKRYLTAFGYVPPRPDVLLISLLLILCSYVAVVIMADETFKDAVIEVRETVFAGTIAVYLLQSLYGQSYEVNETETSSSNF